jgi:hypothetical protein
MDLILSKLTKGNFICKKKGGWQRKLHQNYDRNNSNRGKN